MLILLLLVIIIIITIVVIVIIVWGIMDPRSAMGRGVFGAGSSFRVGWRAAGGVLVSVLPGFSAGVGAAFVSGGRLGGALSFYGV